MTNEEDDHSLMKPLHCTCGRFSSCSEADLQKHKLENHEVLWRCSMNFRFLEDDSVGLCGKTFKKESEFREHMKGHGTWENRPRPPGRQRLSGPR
jgi:hypothetical protein